MSAELRRVVVSSLLSSTPEGLHRMDRLQREIDANRALLPPEVIERLDVAEAELTRALLYGEYP